MRSFVISIAVALLAICPTLAGAQCVSAGGPLANGNLYETFESASGTDNSYQVTIDPGNWIDVIFTRPADAPAGWGTKSGAFAIGPAHGAAYLVNRTSVDSPTGYLFSASFVIIEDGLTENQGITLFIGKPGNGSGNLAAWRLYMAKVNGELGLQLVIGWDSSINNPSAAFYFAPITAGQFYDMTITYDTERRYYLWAVNGEVQAAAAMPCDYPLIGARFIGSSGSSTGRNSAYIVDNVRWYELPE